MKEGDEQAEEQIWKAYFPKLVTFARHKLAGTRKREFDEEDVAIMALNNLFRAVSEQRLPKLDDRLDFWRVLVVIAVREANGHRRRNQTQKRGAGTVRGESVFIRRDELAQSGIEQAAGSQPTPDAVAELAESCQRMIDELEDPELQRIALLKLEGYANREIAEQLGCVERTVERRLERIRVLWSAHFSAG